ncbi:LysE family translocator [Salinimonas lutimaris]|uniref:LysE family translocator n=1 Tax=Salinimonas lutimaris TaxID=914153 RepID=UPI001C2FC992|nr:LysE family translocator [Salinimonas lutimaris]
MMSLSLLSVFIPTFFFVSITPGMCMTLALSLGMQFGYRRTVWMMLGEVIGVGLVALSAVLGVAAIMLKLPWLFTLMKIAGAAYLFYIGLSMWQSKGRLALQADEVSLPARSRLQLIAQGFTTAVANPKGWAFMIALLPPFIEPQQSLTYQLPWLIAIIMCSEFICMSIYATGGKGLKKLLAQSGHVQRMNRISGSLMLGVSIWLLLS